MRICLVRPFELRICFCLRYTPELSGCLADNACHGCVAHCQRAILPRGDRVSFMSTSNAKRYCHDESHKWRAQCSIHASPAAPQPDVGLDPPVPSLYLLTACLLNSDWSATHTPAACKQQAHMIERQALTNSKTSEVTHLRVKRRVVIGLPQQRLQRKEDCCNRVRSGPLVFQYVQTDSTTAM